MDQWHEWENSSDLPSQNKKKEDALLVICNFSNVEYDDFHVVPAIQESTKNVQQQRCRLCGTGVEIRDENRKTGSTSGKLITVKLAPLSVQVFFLYEAETDVALQAIRAQGKTAAKAAAEKKTGKKETG